MKRALVGVSAALLAASVFLAWKMLSGTVKELPPPPAVATASIDALYAVAFPDAEGRSQALAQWRGKVLVVNWWATWCNPCRDEMPELSKLQTRYAARGVQVIGIAAEGAEKVMRHAREAPVAYPLLVGGEDSIKLARPLGNEPLAVPFTVVLDRDGALRAAVLGRVSEQALARLLDKLI
jgi:thiol-disulfide isomerase/thioredoxin